MAKNRSADQPDLFEAQSNSYWFDRDDLAATLDEPPDEEFIERIRNELLATLAKARAAESLPWDLTQSLVAELHFRSIAGWLPRDEARRLRAEFAAEMARLYDVADEHYPFADRL